MQTIDKSVYDGLFHSYKLGKDSDSGITLRHARTHAKAGQAVNDRTRAPYLTVTLNHLDTLKAEEINLEATDISTVAVREASEFTDASITGKAASCGLLCCYLPPCCWL